MFIELFFVILLKYLSVKWRTSWIDHWMILSDQSEEEVAVVAEEEEDTEADLEEAVDSAEEDEVEEGDQAAAPLQEFVPFSCPKSGYVAICVESANRV